MTAIIETDVLVIGSGGAGCRAAFEAVQTGCDVTLVTKGLFGKSGTTAFRVADTAGYNFADGIVDPDDHPDRHLEDIRKAGKGMEYEQLARILADEAVDMARASRTCAIMPRVLSMARRVSSLVEWAPGSASCESRTA